jgi:membrane fusion protein (multidrug efflux system)
LLLLNVQVRAPVVIGKEKEGVTPSCALHADCDGTVESMPAVTGSRASVLPPENATGNYVKVIQRLPVRIRFNEGQKDLDKRRPGMSVEPKVPLD